MTPGEGPGIPSGSKGENMTDQENIKSKEQLIAAEIDQMLKEDRTVTAVELRERKLEVIAKYTK